jgi:hypothetical protein
MGETLVNPFCGIGLSLAFLVASFNYIRQKKYKLASVFLGGSIGLLFTKLAMSVGWLPGGPGGEDLIIFAPPLVLVGMAGGWLICTLILRGNHN